MRRRLSLLVERFAPNRTGSKKKNKRRQDIKISFRDNALFIPQREDRLSPMITLCQRSSPTGGCLFAVARDFPSPDNKIRAGQESRCTCVVCCFAAASQTSHRQRHHDRRFSRAGIGAVFAQNCPFAFPARLHHRARVRASAGQNILQVTVAPSLVNDLSLIKVRLALWFRERISLNHGDHSGSSKRLKNTACGLHGNIRPCDIVDIGLC